MAEGNRYVAVDNGRLIDPDSGDIIWAPAEPTAEQAAPTPMLSAAAALGSPDEAAQIQQPSPKEKSSAIDRWIIAACAAAVVAAGVVIAASIQRRRSST